MEPAIKIVIIVISIEVTMSMRIKRNSVIIVNIVNLFFIILIGDSVWHEFLLLF